ncbi:MAG: hypothetical protein UH081_06820 [Clostridia bacterium]|nr:hypothetical protein [Clostridia bacterium]
MFIVLICLYSLFAIYGIYSLTKKRINFNEYIVYEAVNENDTEYDVRTILKEHPRCTLHIITYIQSDIPYMLAGDFSNIKISETKTRSGDLCI